ncbi:MAG TPA: TIGR02452 family protein [Halanaerobiales bacterium]|nr:TIGR02452 family protein [Halanaerobiales bacterium]
MNSYQRAKLAENTLTIIDYGAYVNFKGEVVDLSEEIKNAVNNSKLYSPEELEKINNEVNEVLINSENKETEIKVTNETTLNAAKRLKQIEDYEKVACLNFASAKNPGGGFLNGSSAQEESLARSSALYPCIKQKKEMYDENKKYDSALYLDYMIYSPEVPVFREDSGSLLDNPYKVSMITAPAVNAGVVRSRESKENENKIEKKMKYRIEKILSIALINKNRALVLGAFGCGVFRNNPEDVADYFRKFIKEDERFNSYFDKIVFAVLDRSRKTETYNIFKRKLM